jgi:hypothetical protein
MTLGRGRIFTVAECVDLWRRYKNGESILSIARALGRRDSSVNKNTPADRRHRTCVTIPICESPEPR